MGAYIYGARNPKLARQVEVEWTDEYEYVKHERTGYYDMPERRDPRPREVIAVAAYAYCFKPSWCDREFNRRHSGALTRLENAWSDHAMPFAVALVDDKRPVIKVGSEVIG